jgi:hypothetical protein
VRCASGEPTLLHLEVPTDLSTSRTTLSAIRAAALARNRRMIGRPGCACPGLPAQSRDPALNAIAARCRRLVTRRALLASGVAMVPLPGLDWLADVGAPAKILPEINAAFGLAPTQIQRLAPQRRIVVYEAITAGRRSAGGQGRHAHARHDGARDGGRVRLTAQPAAKFVPLAGQAGSAAALTFTALKFVCRAGTSGQCIAVRATLLLRDASTAAPHAHPGSTPSGTPA